ncbi:MAG TPA: hypothetical protein VMW17_13725 [Candidatus Binatia bacterium]|nr:hypothetical protein [Candidatus Binatia bacterium]
MPTTDPLIDFLRQQKHDAEREQVDWEEIRESWIRDLHALISQFKEWLRDAVTERLLTVEEYRLTVSEDDLGTYQAPALTIRAPRSRSVQIVPRGRLIVGGTGRVDFESGPNRATLIRVDQGLWKFMTRRLSGSPIGPLFETADLNAESFRGTIRQLLA